MIALGMGLGWAGAAGAGDPWREFLLAAPVSLALTALVAWVAERRRRQLARKVLPFRPRA